METEFGKVFTRNLRRLLYERDKSAADLSRALGIPQSTVSNWMNGNSVPRAKNMDDICEFLGVSRTELLDEYPKPNEPDTHYFDPETEQVAQEIMENQDLKMLFDAARDIPPEELKLIHSMALALKKKENHEE